MTDSNLSPEEFSEQVLKNLMNSEFGLKRFNAILQLSRLEKELLQISSYKSAVFVLNTENIYPLHNPIIERLVLVYPSSFAFSIEYQISGYFKVKYKDTSKTLPIQVEPFNVNYSGILVTKDDEFEIKNEKIAICDR